MAGSFVTVRLTPEEREALDKLVETRSSELDEANVSASSFLRGLLRREATAKGLLASKPKAKPSPRSR